MAETAKVDLVTVVLTTEEARQLVILKAFIAPYVNQKDITYWHIKQLEPALDRIHGRLQEAGHPAVEIGREDANGG